MLGLVLVDVGGLILQHCMANIGFSQEYAPVRALCRISLVVLCVLRRCVISSLGVVFLNDNVDRGSGVSSLH